jgi:hypothetical protein
MSLLFELWPTSLLAIFAGGLGFSFTGYFAALSSEGYGVGILHASTIPPSVMNEASFAESFVNFPEWNAVQKASEDVRCQV